MDREYQRPEVEVVELVTESIADLAEGSQDVVSAPDDWLN